MKTREGGGGEREESDGNPHRPSQSSLYFTSHRFPPSSERLEKTTAMLVSQTNPVEDKVFSFIQ